MNAHFESLADEFYASARLFLKLDLPLERDTVLHFFDQVRKAFPSLRKLNRRADGCLVLEEAPDTGPARRWVRLDPGSLRFGFYAPPHVADFRRLGEVVLQQAPYHLTFSEIDFDHLDVVYAFDLEYEGNHDQLLAETFWADHPFATFLLGTEARHAIDAQPYLGIALSADCDLQAYLDVKSRTTTYEVRTGAYERQPLAVLLTIRRYWGVGADLPLLDAHNRMLAAADRLAANVIVPTVVNPLAQAIASRS